MENPRQVHDLLDTSLQQYTEMLQVLRTLQGELEFSTMTAATGYFKQYRNLEKEARDNDGLLVEKLGEYGAKETLDKAGTIKLDMLIQLQSELQTEIGTAATRAGNIKMLLKEEKSSIANGRSAMRGYRSLSGRNGKILNGSC